MSVCPAYFKWCEDNPQEPSEDMVIGSAFHKIVLEPETFYDEFAVMPNVDRRTTQGKMKYAEFIIEADGKTVITQEQYETIYGMRDSIMSNPYARKLINGNIEQSMYFTDDLTGVRCKCRPDVWKLLKGKEEVVPAHIDKYADWDGNIIEEEVAEHINKQADRVVITDLKSAKSVMPNDFMRDCVKYHYDLQTAMYREGASKVLGVPKDNIDFVFIAVEKKPPYLLNIMQADTYVIQKGEADFREYIGTYKECLETQNWYGLNGSMGIINTLSLPEYLIKKEN